MHCINVDDVYRLVQTPSDLAELRPELPDCAGPHLSHQRQRQAIAYSKCRRRRSAMVTLRLSARSFPRSFDCKVLRASPNSVLRPPTQTSLQWLP
jgi:hypothetical protein